MPLPEKHIIIFLTGTNMHVKINAYSRTGSSQAVVTYQVFKKDGVDWQKNRFPVSDSFLWGINLDLGTNCKSKSDGCGGGVCIDALYLPNTETSVTLTDVTPESLSLSWDAIPNADVYTITYSDGVTTETTQVTTPFATLTGLNPGTDYDIVIESTGPTGTTNVGSLPARTGQCHVSCLTCFQNHYRRLRKASES